MVLISNKLGCSEAKGITKTLAFLSASIAFESGAGSFSFKTADSVGPLAAVATPTAAAPPAKAAKTGLMLSVTFRSITFLSKTAPWSIHQVKSEICDSVSWVLPLGGMWCSSSSGNKQRFSISLSALLPAKNIGPFSPPFFINATWSIRNSPFILPELWHCTQLCFKIGCTTC